MKAGAAATLRRLLEARSAGPEEPCALLLGTSAEARSHVRNALGATGALDASRQRPFEEESGCRLRAELLESGGVLVELPDDVRGTAEVTEVATFLRGLRDAHAILLACNEHVPSSSSCASSPLMRGREPPQDTLPLLAEFYGQDDLPVILAVTASEDSTQEARGGHVRNVRGRLAPPRPGSPAVGSGGSVSIQVISVEGPAQRQELLSLLRGFQGLPCEPLRSASPLLAQYRAIRQQLDQRRPPSPRPTNLRERDRGVSEQILQAGDSQESGPADPAGIGGGLAAGQSPPQSCGGKPVSPSQPVQIQSVVGGLSLPHRRQWVLMVFGKTGAGKSHLANLLVGHTAFVSCDSMASVTKEESVRKAESCDRSLMVLDTIGFGDTKLPPESVTKSLRDTALEAPTGIDALIFVLKKERVTSAEEETLLWVTQDLFGRDCLPNLYMVVTHAGRLAKDADLREPWLKEQAAASQQFASILGVLGARPEQRIAFVENADPSEAEDEDDRVRAEQRRQRALVDIRGLLESHNAAPFVHGIMHRAGEFHAKRLEEMRAELRARVESEVRRELDKDRGALEEERSQLRAEVEVLKEREESLQKRFEEEWVRMRTEFEARARELAREDLEPVAQEIIEKTEKKANGRWCSLM